MFSATKSRTAHVTLILTALLILLSAIPPGTAQAALIVPKLISNDVKSFSDGSFQRAQLSTYETPAASAIDDTPGAVQLMPIGVVRFRDRVLSELLPYGVIRSGVAVVGNRIYMIGGIAKGGTKPGTNPVQPYNSEAVDRVFSAEINTTDSDPLKLGDLKADEWRAEASLNPTRSSDAPGLTADAAVLHSPAVTSVAIGGKNYIYVIGGNTRVDATRDFSSNAVRIGEVAADGRVTWKVLAGAKIPSITAPTPELPTPLQRGVQGASAVTMTVNGSAYVFLIGGLQRYLEGGSQQEDAGSRAVFWAKVDPATGNLLKRDGTQGWERMVSLLPVATANARAGLWDAAAVAGQYNINSEEYSVDKAIYIVGGQIAPSPSPEYASDVVQLYVTEADDGWIEPSLSDLPTDTLPRSRYGHSGVTFRGKHYLTGGISPQDSTTPLSDMLVSYVENNLGLATYGGEGGANFLADPQALVEPRAFHSMAIIPAGESAYVYIIGGQTNALASATPSYSQEVIFGKIGGQQEAEASGFASDGWYHSKPIDFNFSNAQVQEISWSTLINEAENTDIEVSFRTSLANNCNNPGWDASSWNPTLDGNTSSSLFSKNGDNLVPLTNVVARCFQYRARLVGGAVDSEGLVTATPSLLYLSLKILLPGSPDLRSDLDKEDIKALFNTENKLTGLQLRIRNRNGKSDLQAPLFEPTLSANAELRGGTFFVDLFVYPPGETPVKPTIPIPDTSANNVACSSVAREAMGPDAVYSLADWYTVAPNTSCDIGARFDLLQLVQARGAGEYTVFLVIDSTCGNGDPKGCVDETDAKAGEGEANNVVEYKFTVPAPSVPGGGLVSYDIQLPMVNTQP
ncbi:MAG: hypothetical protein H7Z42_07890 [Roseiflexaceae bacterium]|nr:hypothetical protein [Roseiflexaceae bacterium]